MRKRARKPMRVIKPGETRYILEVNETEAVSLVSGWVPPAVRGRVLLMLDHQGELARMQGSRPMEPTKRRG